jgi:branched-chain amino acid transport system ATP-binding protein|tara:strand:+ start:2885 stop:3586 length:702 start_codon:yes stop_codon:yes gene_type:complete
VSEDPILEVEGLCTYYGTSQALFDASLVAPRTGGVAILGLNGAGKTTLMKSIIGELNPARGRLVLDGSDVTKTPTHQRIRQGIGYVPQERAVFGSLSVHENLLVGGLSNSDKSGIDRVVEIFPKIGERMSQIAGTLSGGERKMLGIGRALLSNPRILLLDEPTEGVWIGVVEEIAERLEEMTTQISVVIVEQHVELALRISSHAYVMDRGQVVMYGASGELPKNPNFMRYLTP